MILESFLPLVPHSSTKKQLKTDPYKPYSKAVESQRDQTKKYVQDQHQHQHRMRSAGQQIYHKLSLSDKSSALILATEQWFVLSFFTSVLVVSTRLADADLACV